MNGKEAGKIRVSLTVYIDFLTPNSLSLVIKMSVFCLVQEVSLIEGVFHTGDL